MNFLDYALDKVHDQIPEILLNRAFGSTQWEYVNNRMSVDARIRSKIIHGTVLRDCNVVGGETIEISLTRDASWQWVDSGVRITIPMYVTHNRKINSILSVEEVSRGMEGYAPTQGTAAPTGHVECFLVAPNTIFMPLSTATPYIFLRCTLENDPLFNNMAQRSWLVLVDLVLYAVKGHIYRELAINNSFVSSTGGNVDSRMREEIDSYRDAWETYRDILSVKFRKISMIQDKYFHRRLIKMGIKG